MRDTDKKVVVHAMGGPKEYAKFAIVIVSIVAVSLTLERTNFADWMTAFMGVYLLVFGLLKLADLKMFAHGFSEYDPIAKRFKQYGYMYPFLELGLSIAFLAVFLPITRNVLVINIFGINAVGVLGHLNDKDKIRCACLGKFVSLPLTTITLTEDVLMVLMAAAGLLM